MGQMKQEAERGVHRLLGPRQHARDKHRHDWKQHNMGKTSSECCCWHTKLCPLFVTSHETVRLSAQIPVNLSVVCKLLHNNAEILFVLRYTSIAFHFQLISFQAGICSGTWGQRRSLNEQSTCHRPRTARLEYSLTGSEWCKISASLFDFKGTFKGRFTTINWSK